MNSEDKRQVVINKEDAVFWMDADGNWHNRHGRFEHPRIIKYFNESIQKDDQGYFVSQMIDGAEEKVYFRYEETALFAVDVRAGSDALVLVLNTGRAMPLDPSLLELKDDSLFLRTDTELIKFTSHAMVRLSRYMKEENGRLFLTCNGKDWPVG